MSIERSIFEHLKANAGVFALVADRIYDQRRPQNPVYPCIVFLRISTPRDITHDGPSGLASPRFEFDCYALDETAAGQVADAVRLALNGFSGSMGTGAPVDVDGCFLEDDQVGYEDEGRVFSRALDFVIWHAE